MSGVQALRSLRETDAPAAAAVARLERKTAEQQARAKEIEEIALRVVLGKTHREVARELAITEGEVTRRMRDLRAAVRATVDAADS